jgi:hypothetical protein
LKKNPLRDLRGVTEYPEALNKRFLEAEDSQEGIHISSSMGEGRRTKSLRGLSV